MQYRHISTHAHTHTYIYILCHGQEQGRKGRGKEVQSDGCKVAQPKCAVGALCIWQIEYQELNVDAGILGCHGEGCEIIMVHAS